MTRLEDMTTAEIAEAVDARKYWRGLHHRILCIARSGALTWFLFQNLLYFRINLFLIFAITAFALVAELRTNRFMLTTYSTSEIVDLLMKRASLERTKSIRGKLVAGGCLLWLASVVACGAGASVHLCYAGLFSGAALLVWTIKCSDQISFGKGGFFDYSQSHQNRFHVQVRRSLNADKFLLATERPGLSLVPLSLSYAGLAMALFFGFAFFLFGGFDTLQTGQHIILGVAILFSALGCAFHEPARFHLVQSELDRLEAKTKRNGTC